MAKLAHHSIKCKVFFVLSISLCLIKVKVKAQIVFPSDLNDNGGVHTQNANVVSSGGGRPPSTGSSSSSINSSKDNKEPEAKAIGGDDGDYYYVEEEVVDAADYYDELLMGYNNPEFEKRKRQQGCLCLKNLQDPHCGSDFNIYDNGCFFECAQKRNPRLTLRSWGPCF